jgi:hypothetical protein
MRPEPTGLALAVPGSIPLLFFFVCCVPLGTLCVISWLPLGTGCSVGTGLPVSTDCPGNPPPLCCPFPGNSRGVVGFGTFPSPSPGFCEGGVRQCLGGRVIITQGTAGAQVSDGRMKGRITWGGSVGADLAGSGITGGIWGELGLWGCVLDPGSAADDGADDDGAAVAVDGPAGTEGGVALKTLLPD